MSGVVISLVQFNRGLFCSSIFIFLYIDEKGKIKLIARGSHSNYELFLRIYKYYNKTKPPGISSNIYFIYKKLLQGFLKSICLVKELFLVNPFIGVFLRNITISFTTVSSQNATHFWYLLHYTINLLLLLSCLLTN